MRILVTGGAGFIGSHTCVELLGAGYKVLVLDNLSNSKLRNLEKVSIISKIKLDLNEDNRSQFSFVRGDIQDKVLLSKLFSHFDLEGVIHFAGLKAIGESVLNPIKYFKNNVAGAITLLEVMKDFDCKNFVFSSSASVYGEPNKLPIRENSPLKANNPYAESKLIVENLLRDIFKSDKEWNIALLRYFNPIGAHNSGLIGDNPNNTPNNLVPFISQVAMGRLKELSIYGADYETIDGTGVRDYVHVVDIALSHVKALNVIKSNSEVLTVNLGTGVGYSVFELIRTFEKISNKKIPYKIVKRRPGDLAINYADPTYAKEKLGWKAEKNLEKMCIDTWNFQKNFSD